MKLVTKYEAHDGKLFGNEADCLKHEDACASLAAANEMLQNGSTLMESLTCLHRAQVEWGNRLSAEDKTCLMRITKDTGFVISHWQCRYEPGYKPCELDLAGRVYLWGNAGSWSGAYGGWCSVDDVLRYAADTVKQASPMADTL